MSRPNLWSVPRVAVVEPVQPVAPVGRPDWALRGLCVGRDPDTLFVTGAAQRVAARMCIACPVRLECLAEALDNQVEFGVWGGMTERERRALVKKAPQVTDWLGLLGHEMQRFEQDAG